MHFFTYVYWSAFVLRWHSRFLRIRCHRIVCRDTYLAAGVPQDSCVRIVLARSANKRFEWLRSVKPSGTPRTLVNFGQRRTLRLT